jgi:hypothetical protein
MPRKKMPVHMYSVFVNAYVDEETRARIERGEEVVTLPEQLTSELFYFGRSERQAGYAFYKATRTAMNNPLASP